MDSKNEEKLKNFEYEAMNDAQRVCDEIKSNIKLEFQEKLDAGEKQILSDIYNLIQSSIDKIKKEKSLEISRASIEYRHEYLKYSDTMFAGIFEKINERLSKFLASGEYLEYLKASCINIIGKLGAKAKIDILYKPSDEAMVLNLKPQLKDIDIKDININTDNINFIPDNDIKIGGFRFRDTEKNILINDILDEKIARSKEMLTASIGMLFREANQN